MNEAVATEAQAARARLGEISPIAMTPSAMGLFQRYQALPVKDRPAFIRGMRALGIPGTAMTALLLPCEKPSQARRMTGDENCALVQAQVKGGEYARQRMTWPVARANLH